MAGLTLGMKSFVAGLIAYTAVLIASYLYHRWKKQYSFVIKECGSKAIVKRNPLTSAFNSVAHFFLYSLLSVVTMANIDEKTAFIQLAVIYTICLLVVLVEYYFRASFQIVLDKKNKTLKTKDAVYSFQEVKLEISDRSFWRTDDYGAYGLYIKTTDDKSKLIYGTSALWDIKELKTQIDSRLNSHQQRFAAIQADE